MINPISELLLSGTASTLLSLSLQASGSDIEGRYVASAGPYECRVVLMGPASRPEDSLLSPDTISGLAAVRPGCALPLGETGLWTLSEEGSRLTLSGFGGLVLWTGEIDGTGAWTGGTPQGLAITLDPA